MYVQTCAWRQDKSSEAIEMLDHRIVELRTIDKAKARQGAWAMHKTKQNILLFVTLTQN